MSNSEDTVSSGATETSILDSTRYTLAYRAPEEESNALPGPPLQTHNGALILPGHPHWINTPPPAYQETPVEGGQNIKQAQATSAELTELARRREQMREFQAPVAEMTKLLALHQNEIRMLEMRDCKFAEAISGASPQDGTT